MAGRTPAERTRRAGAILAYLVSLAVLLTGIGFAGYAALEWLRTARWQPLTINGVLAGWPETREWVAHPRSWLGLHRVVTWILRVPVFVMAMLVGGLLLALSTPPMERISGRRQFR